MPNILAGSQFDRSRRYQAIQTKQPNWNFTIYYINDDAYFIDTMSFQNNYTFGYGADVYLPKEGNSELLIIRTEWVTRPGSMFFDQAKNQYQVPILAKMPSLIPWLVEKLNILAYVPSEKSKQWKLLYLAIVMVLFSNLTYSGV